MSSEENFEAAVISSKELTARPNNEHLLKLYAYYKQATAGDATGERPGGFDFKGAAKYDAWANIEGLSKEEAMDNYIKLVAQLHGE
jgi:diazepam-binding inhibitor (GABA receptor modulating acyl-CoA-binding protein)